MRNTLSSLMLVLGMLTIASAQTPYNFDLNSFPGYSLNVRVEPEARRLNVEGTIQLPAAATSRDALQLALSKSMPDFSVNFEKPFSEAAKLEKRELGRRLFLWTIRPSTPIKAGESVVLRVSYSATNDPVMPTMYLGPEGSFAISQSTGVPWYPLADRTARVTGSLHFSVPEGYTAISTGRNRTSEDQARKGNFHFEVTEPSALSFGVARYTVLRRANGRVPVSAYLLRPRQDAQKFLDGAERIIEHLEKSFGPYPFGEFALVEAPANQFKNTLGVVAVSLENFLLVSGAIVPDQAIATGINLPFYAHEIAHQWWAVLLQLQSGEEHLVLTEGVANYAALLVVEALEGETSAARYRRLGYPGYDELTQSGRGYFRMVQTGNDRKLTSLTLDDVSHQLATNKGFLMHDMLSRVMGRERHEPFMRDFVHAHAFQSVSMEDFRRAAERAYGKSLQWFFEQWLERTGAPNFQLTWQRGKDNRVSGVITQRAPHYYTMLEVELIGSDGKRLLHNVEVFGERTTFNWQLPIKVNSIVLDPDYKVLRWTPEFADLVRRSGDGNNGTE